MNRLHFYIAVKPTPPVDAEPRENPAVPTSNWAIAGAVLVASVPHLWKFLSGQQQAQTSLTSTLLQNLTEAHKQYSVSNESFRAMIESVVERPMELAESNAQVLRDLQGEIADLRGLVQALNKKIEGLAAIVARLAQNKEN
jgi:septation ring formation regulator EzrA